MIKLPHLNSTIIVEKATKNDPIIRDGAAAYAKRMCAEEYKLVVPLPIKGPKSAGSLVHELIHILQYIVDDGNMSFTYEREHLAYIAGYVFEEVCKL